MNGFWGSQSERCFVDVNADTGPYPGFLVGWGVLFQKKWTFLNEVCYKYGMQSMPVSKGGWGDAPPPPLPHAGNFLKLGVSRLNAVW